jgi:peptide/nickel transport system permease protein
VSIAAAFPARAAGNPSIAIGGTLTLALLLTAALSLLWTPWSPYAIDVPHRLQLPTARHWFGTDGLGRDVLSMLMAGAQNSILVGVIAVATGLLLGVGLGALAAARGGFIEEGVMRLVDFTFAFPAILSAIMLTAVLRPGIVNAIIAIGIFNVPIFARVTRGSAKALWQRDFVLAARATGRAPLGITLVHVLPNMLSPLLVQATIQFANAILWEAALSYLGLGTQPPQPSWGRMLDDAQAHLFQAPWLALFPGIAIMLAVLGLNLLGDGLRDLYDPRLVRR